MAPFDWTGIGFYLVNLLLGIGFGVALERGGFGDSRRIAAQFYLTDLTVLKVMFTAIVVAMLMTLWAQALGFLDPARVWIDRTYLASGSLGGFLLGMGMVVGGYCPGTSLVASSNLKIDGFFFIGGLLFGITVFGESVNRFWDFFQQDGFRGMFTLDQWLHTTKGMTAVVVTLISLAAFWGSERLERLQPAPAGGRRVPGAGIKAGAVILLLAAFGLILVPQPGLSDRLVRLGPELDRTLSRREVQIDPAELVDLMHNNQVRLMLLDVRDEADFNLFHLLDAEHRGPGDLTTEFARSIDPEELVVVMSNDEVRATAVWKALRADGVRGAYILAGGINQWLDLYGGLADPPALPVSTAAGTTAGMNRETAEPLRYVFPAALGDRTEIAWPDPHHMHLPERTYTPKAKVLKPVTLAGGGCG